MEIAKPKCPECGKHIFCYRIILDEKALITELENKDAVIKDNMKIEALLEQKMHLKRSANPFALAFCINCGHIVGFAGRGYS